MPKLPAAVIADPQQQVLAASQVAPALHSQTVSTVNTETGAVETYIKTDPYPWLAIEARGEISTAYGYKFKPASWARGRWGACRPGTTCCACGR